jgi:inhibitor of cysteine peptidase
VNRLQLFPSDRDRIIAVRGETVATVSLPENPTTGYQWAVEKSNAETIAPLDSEYIVAPESAVGAAGIRRFTFELMKAGTYRLELKHWRDWEGDASVTERFAATIEVR